MSKKSGIIVVIISIIALCIASVSVYFALKPAEAEVKDVQYVMYVGTNDKDTNEPVCTREEAKAKAENILIKHFGGYTIQDAEGGWLGDDGKRYEEYSLVIYLSDTDKEAVHKAADDFIKEFNQSSILIQANETKTEFYSTNE
ncbi:MAG: DUF3574 domain-containing protein [Eubacterium sp.]|nr:DUF3574 domain-containing protein [Eubacterium sp.]